MKWSSSFQTYPGALFSSRKPNGGITKKERNSFSQPAATVPLGPPEAVPIQQRKGG